MSFEVGSPRCARKLSENRERSILQKENLLYVQPTKARPTQYNKPYKKPIQKIDASTTYGLSYAKFDCEYAPSRARLDLEKYYKRAHTTRGKFNFNTVYKLSYYADSKGNVRKPFVPKSCLSINGYHDMTTTQKLSYGNPGYVRTVSIKPYKGKPCHSIPMESKTIMKESYQHFDVPIVKSQVKRKFWQTKFKTDYQTTSHLSYQYVEPFPKRSQVRYTPKVSVSFEKNTVYNTSYQMPGCFVTKDSTTSA